MLIKKKQVDSTVWPQPRTASSYRRIPSTKHHDFDDWPPAPYGNDDDSGCSFSSAPSFSDDDDEDQEKDFGDKDTKLPPPTKHPQHARYYFQMMPTTIHVQSPDSVGETADNDSSSKDDKVGPHSNSNSTNELYQIGSMVVVGLVGLLVVFAGGAVVGEHQHRQDLDKEDHFPYWDTPRRLPGHRHFRDW